MPCAIKSLPYYEPLVMGTVDVEITVLRAVAESPHTLTLLSEDTALVDSKPHKLIATK